LQSRYSHIRLRQLDPILLEYKLLSAWEVENCLKNIWILLKEYRESVMTHFKDMDVEVKEWNVSVGKIEKEYDVNVTLKLALKPKKA
jgi:hypothetical protein